MESTQELVGGAVDALADGDVSAALGLLRAARDHASPVRVAELFQAHPARGNCDEGALDALKGDLPWLFATSQPAVNQVFSAA